MNPTIPDFGLNAARRLGSAFLELGVGRFREAARFVSTLPYGRNADRADYRSVLLERRGTCSTKHALLAALAAETGAPIRLALGIYLMNEANTPGVGAVLSASGLDAVPEAHCYLVCDGARIDLTWPGRVGEPPPVILEELIQPSQIGVYKLRRHQDFVHAWAAERGCDANRVWAVREACIAALGSSEGAVRSCVS